MKSKVINHADYTILEDHAGTKLSPGVDDILPKDMGFATRYQIRKGFDISFFSLNAHEENKSEWRADANSLSICIFINASGEMITETGKNIDLEPSKPIMMYNKIAMNGYNNIPAGGNIKGLEIRADRDFIVKLGRFEFLQSKYNGAQIIFADDEILMAHINLSNVTMIEIQKAVNSIENENEISDLEIERLALEIIDISFKQIDVTDCNFGKNIFYNLVQSIEDAPQKSWTIKKMAKEMNTNEKAIQKFFNNELETTPNRFLQKIRVLKAAELIKKGNLTVTEACFCVGFTNQSHMAKLFKNILGHTPSELKAKRYTA